MDHKFPLKREVPRGQLPLSEVVRALLSDRSIVSVDRQLMLYQLAKLTTSVPGNVVEVGVYKGGTAKILADVFPDKMVHLCDTFEGMPPTADVDLHFEHAFNDVNVDEVKRYLKKYRNVAFHVGLFPQEFPYLKSLSYCFAHVDCDIYQSVKDCCEMFWCRMYPGGIILFDDYGSPSTPGAKLAVDEFCEKHSINKVYLPTGQCFILRR